MSFGTYIGVGEETTWGTAVTRNKFASIMEGTKLDHVVASERSRVLATAGGADPKKYFNRSQNGMGRIVMPLSYDDGAFFKILKHLFGFVASTSGAGPYTHVLKRSVVHSGGAVNTAVSLSVEEEMGLPDGAGSARLLAGARVASGNFSCNTGEEPTLDCELMGKEVTQITKTASPSFPDRDLYQAGFAQASLSIGGNPFATVCRGFDFTINNNHALQTRLGSEFTQKPKREGVAELTGNIRLDWEASPAAKTLWDASKSGALLAIVLTLTDGTYSLALSLAKTRITGSTTDPVEGEVQPTEFTYGAQDDATDTAAKLTIITPNSTI